MLGFTLFHSFIENLNWCLGLLFWTVFTLAELAVSLRRIQEVLTLEEKIVHNSQMVERPDTSTVVSFRNLKASWFPKAKKQEEKRQFSSNRQSNIIRPTSVQEENLYFDNLTFQVHRGEFVGVSGAVGSGKSAFLSIFLNEMKLEGSFWWDRRISHCSQEP